MAKITEIIELLSSAGQSGRAYAVFKGCAKLSLGLVELTFWSLHIGDKRTACAHFTVTFEYQRPLESLSEAYSRIENGFSRHLQDA